jgi:hypothetical protein
MEANTPTTRAESAFLCVAHDRLAHRLEGTESAI